MKIVLLKTAGLDFLYKNSTKSSHIRALSNNYIKAIIKISKCSMKNRNFQCRFGRNKMEDNRINE